MRRRTDSGAGQTEYVVIVTAVAIVMIVSLTVYGHKIQALFRGGIRSLDRGTPSVRDTATSSLDIYTDTTIANPRGTTNPTLAAANGVAAINGLAIDPALSESDRNRLIAALNRLPPAVRDAGIAGLTHQGAQNAFFNPNNNRVEFGPFAVAPNGDQHLNDFLGALSGANQRWTLERVLYHEMIHAVQHNNPALANSFLNIAYNNKYNALQADPALATARTRYNNALQAVINAHTPPPPLVDASGTVNVDLLQSVLDRNHALRDELYAANRDLTAVVDSHGLPSRYPGDTHAGGDAGQSLDSGRAEYFAMVMETARHDPATFADWRARAADADPTNDVLTQAEIDWVDAHPELIR